MGKVRKQHSDAFKFKVAMAALKGDRTSSELCREFEVHSSQVFHWRKQLLESGPKVFSDKRYHSEPEASTKISKLHEKIGELTVERDFLCKALGS